MAAFFDDKQEVINIELTEWGKYLYSIGKFKPSHYAFFDDEVLYDNSYGGNTSEEQKEIEERIMNSTPYLKPITRLTEAKSFFEEYNAANSVNPSIFDDPLDSMTKVDTEIQNMVDLLKLKAGRYSQKTRELEFLARNRLGTVRTTTQDYPAFNVTMMRSTISTASNSFASDYGYLKIPQIDVNLESVLTVVPSGSVFVSKMNEKVRSPDFVQAFNTQNQSVVFEDGSTIYLENNFVALDLFQDGVEYSNKNFTVELYQYVTGSGSGYELKRLKLPTSPNDRVDEDGFLTPRDSFSLPNEEITLPEDTINSSILDLESSSTYFNILVDRSIPDEVICALYKEVTNRGDNLRLDYDLECTNTDLSYTQAELVKNIPAPGIELSQANCDEEQGGSGCRNQ